MSARIRILAACALLAVGASACGGGADAAPDPCDGKQLRLPPVLGGLTAEPNAEAAKKLLDAGGKETYARQASVFVLRQGKELRGIFEIVRLTPDARPDDPAFRRKIVADIGGARRNPERIGDALVYKGSQNQQLFFIWFEDCFLEVLIVREDETVKGRAVGVDIAALLRDALAVTPVDAKV